MTASIRTAKLPRFATLTILGLAGLMLVASLPSDAAESKRIHFKNGHVLDVRDFRIEGETVFATLADGSEVGFPALLIERAVDSEARLEYSGSKRTGPGVEWSSPSGRFGRWEDLPSVQKRARSRGASRVKRETTAKKPFIAAGALTGGQTVGYSYREKGRADDPRVTKALNAQQVAKQLSDRRNDPELQRVVRSSRAIKPADVKLPMLQPGAKLESRALDDGK